MATSGQGAHISALLGSAVHKLQGNDTATAGKICVGLFLKRHKQQPKRTNTFGETGQRCPFILWKTETGIISKAGKGEFAAALNGIVFCLNRIVREFSKRLPKST
ncbi:hypothetical protein DdX_15218 [Ditylenchus destructor]|uniref:Uncharacterized protein n=1 Tax=Ditylenchus destructor TaxID=166010 RepID=A0AAD4MRB6_9BILA|nr:hypothetical protein DdX_15218 [Ditylenchus destructor]